MPTVTNVAIYYEAFTVGQIEIDADGTLAFNYDPRWLATTGHFPLSVSMPLTPYTFGNSTIAPWLANLLP